MKSWHKRDRRSTSTPMARSNLRRNLLLRFNALWVLAAGAALLWLSGSGSWRSNPGLQNEGTLAYVPPHAGAPKLSRAAVNNNDAAELKLAPDLEGVAVIYPEQVDGLISADGSFRTDLAPEKMAAVLRINHAALRKERSAELDPDATLFTAIIGRLSARAKALSRRVRESEARAGRPMSAAGYEWETTLIGFSLNSLKHPNPEEKRILNAIIRCKRRLPRRGGAGINAIGLPLEQADLVKPDLLFGAGFLPLEERPALLPNQRPSLAVRESNTFEGFQLRSSRPVLLTQERSHECDFNQGLPPLACSFVFSRSGSASSQGFLIGSSFSVSGTNSPTNFNDSVTVLPGTSTLDGGLLSLTQTIVVNGNSDWLNLNFEANRGLLASNLAAAWEIDVEGVQLSSPAYLTGIMVYWTVNRAPAEPIHPFLVFSPVGPNPLSPSGQEAYVRSFAISPGSPLYSSIGEFASISRYNAISEGGMNPSTVNGFDLAIRITSVPEPSSLVLAGIGGICGSCLVVRRRRCRIRAEGRASSVCLHAALLFRLLRRLLGGFGGGRRLLEQHLDDVAHQFQGVVIGLRDGQAHLAGAVNNHERRKPLEAGDLLDGRVVGDHARVVHPHLLGEGFDKLASLGFILDLFFVVQADQLQALGFAIVIQVHQMRDRLLAGTAPGAPEVDEHNLSLEVRERDRFRIQVAMSELKWQVDRFGQLGLHTFSRRSQARGVMGFDGCLELRRLAQRGHLFIFWNQEIRFKTRPGRLFDRLDRIIESALLAEELAVAVKYCAQHGGFLGLERFVGCANRPRAGNRPLDGRGASLGRFLFLPQFERDCRSHPQGLAVHRVGGENLVQENGGFCRFAVACGSHRGTQRLLDIIGAEACVERTRAGRRETLERIVRLGPSRPRLFGKLQVEVSHERLLPISRCLRLGIGIYRIGTRGGYRFLVLGTPRDRSGAENGGTRNEPVSAGRTNAHGSLQLKGNARSPLGLTLGRLPRRSRE